jgi:hypothetical protein
VIGALGLVIGASVSWGAERELAITEHYPARAGKRIVVDAANLNLRFRAAAIDAIEVRTELRIAGVGERKADAWIADHTPEVVDSPDELILRIRPQGSGFLGFGVLTTRARLTVVAPHTVSPDLTTSTGDIDLEGDFWEASPLRLRTAGGAITFLGAADSLDIRSTKGDSRITVVRPLSSFFARTAGGSVTLVGGAQRCEVDTASGDVEMTGLSGSTIVETSTGKVILRWDRLGSDDTVRVRSTSGRVELHAPADVRPRGTITSTTGTIHCGLAEVCGDQAGILRLSGDGPTFDVETASGSIELGVRDPWQE